MWYLRDKSKVSGPFTEAELRIMHAQRKFLPEHQVSSDRQRWESAAPLVQMFVASQEAKSTWTAGTPVPLQPGLSSEPSSASYCYLDSSRKQKGPLTQSEIMELARIGILQRTSLVCQAGGGEWKPASEHTFLEAAIVARRSGFPKMALMAASASFMLMVIIPTVYIATRGGSEVPNKAVQELATNNAEGQATVPLLSGNDVQPPTATNQPQLTPALPPNEPKVANWDPASYLVLIGIGDIKSDNRPHLLGVGWLYDEKTAIVPRELGKILQQLVKATQDQGLPRQACVVQGVPLEVASIDSPTNCPQLSLLRLKEPGELAIPARERWSIVNETNIERRRARSKAAPIRYVSFAALPKASSNSGAHGLSLIAYDPERVKTSEAEAHFLYERQSHVLRTSGAEERLERGGILVDESGRILGTVVSDSSVIWTEALQRAFTP